MNDVGLRQQEITPQRAKAWLHDGREIALLDVREHGQFGESHPFLAVPLPFSRLELEIARLVPRRSTRCVLVDSGEADTLDVATRAKARLEALGYTDVSVLQGGTRSWREAGYTLFAGVNLPSKTLGELVEQAAHTPRVSPDELAAWLQQGRRVIVLDGRPPSEFRKMNIPSAVCCPNGELAWRLPSLVPDDSTPIVINCAGRTRSIIGAQTLIDLGVPNPVYALENGTQGWMLAGNQLEHGASRCYEPESGSDALLPNAQQLARRVGVPEVSAEQVLLWAAEPDRTLYLCDVRTLEEFAQGSLPGAQHTPGGQLIQAFDQYVGVRRARLVLFDSDGVRARTVASWLRQMGHDACVLQYGLSSGLRLAPVKRPEPPALPTIGARGAALRLQESSATVLDLRASMDYRKGHIAGARWATRAGLAECLPPKPSFVVLVADDPALAAWAVSSEWPRDRKRPLLLEGSMDAWRDAGLPEVTTPQDPPDADCIDFLFFVHDRHDGNKDAARRYLAWETGLVGQLDPDELAAFSLPVRGGETTAP